MNRNDRDFLIKIYEIFDDPSSIKPLSECLYEYCRMNDYENIVLYGFGKLGQLLFDNFQTKNINVGWVIDKNENIFLQNTERICLGDLRDMHNIDVIFVSAMMEYEIIEKEVSELCNIPVISAKELLVDIVTMCVNCRKGC